MSGKRERIVLSPTGNPSKLKAFCHTCRANLYDTEEADSTTHLVAVGTAAGHALAYANRHRVSVIQDGVEIMSSDELAEPPAENPKLLRIQ